MAKETRAYYGALASVPSGPGSRLVPLPDAGFLLSGYPRPPIASGRKYSVPLRSQERGGTEVLSGDIHPTGFPCLNAAGFCSYPKRMVMETYRAKPRIRPSPTAGHGILYSAGLRISELLEQGTDIKIVKELMGHNNIKTTERYVHAISKARWTTC